MGKRALVCSGGGAKGAWGGGIGQYFIENLGNEYDMYIGSSTGNLLNALFAVEDIRKLREGYTSVTQSDIFTLSPFKVKQKKNGMVKHGVKPISMAWNMWAKRQKSFGDSRALRETIKRFVSEQDFKVSQQANKEVVSAVTNFTLGETEYKCNLDQMPNGELMKYEDFIDWMWASSCAYPWMTLVEKNNYEYVDGGYKEAVPIQEAIARGATIIDVIDLNPVDGGLKIEKVRSAFHGTARAFDLFLENVAIDDKAIARLKADDNDVQINIYHTPRILTNNSLIFNKETMNNWWDEAYEYAQSHYSRGTHRKTWELIGNRKPKLVHDGTK